MQTALERLDRLAGIDASSGIVAWLERVAFAFLVLTVVSAPHSIAATQTAWITGMFVWFVRLFFKPRVRFRFTLLDAALWAFFLWSVVTSFTSYAPDISINKLRGAAVFLIFYFVLYNIRNRRAAHVLAFALIGSCMINVLWMPVHRLIGRGVEIHGVSHDSPLAKVGLMAGDTLLEANGRKLRTPDDVAAAVELNEITKIKFYRPDFEFVVDVKRSDLLAGTTALERLGVSEWKKSRNWRSSGFFGHYTTYAEVLQLIAALVLGLLVAGFSNRFSPSTEERRGEGETGRHGDGETGRHGDGETGGHGDAAQLTQSGSLTPLLHVSLSPRLRVSLSPLLPFSPSPLLLFCLAAMMLALLMTVTRGSQLGFLVSAGVIVMVGLGRKWLFTAAAIAVPLGIIGLFVVQQSRHVGFFDPNDESTRWRQTVWREGYDLWTASPRNFVFGVGMDSIKRHAPEWHLFDNGRLPMGHFHSTPLNLLVERGLPALLLWLTVLGVYARSLWRSLNPKSKIQNFISIGVLLGCLGGAAGFFVSGLVHYNLGDQEVAMVFFLLMGVSTRLINGGADSSVGS